MRSCERHPKDVTNEDVNDIMNNFAHIKYVLQISPGAASRPYRPSDRTSNALDFLEFNGSRLTSVFTFMGDLWLTHHAAVGGHNTLQAAPRAEEP